MRARNPWARTMTMSEVEASSGRTVLQVGPKKVANGEINGPTGRVLGNEPRLLDPDEHRNFFFAVATLDHDWRPAW